MSVAGPPGTASQFRIFRLLSQSGRGTLALPAAVLTGIAIALVLSAAGNARVGRLFGLIFLGLVSLPLLLRTFREALRGNFATDAIAALSILTALALQQPIPGLIIVLMQSGGESLERIAQRRASRALAALEAAAPRIAHRKGAAGYDDVEVERLRIGDVVLVRPGELVPADGVVEDGRSHVDTAQITGEPIPVLALKGTRMCSGFGNLSGPLVMSVTTPAAESQYERIVKLVRDAQATKAPIQRLADRYAVWFTPLTIAVAAGVYLVTGDPLRVLAVLVVATPCPLILATPIAVIGGMNSAARHNIIVRNGATLEQMGDVKAAVFDKTGTLTTGRPIVELVVPQPGWLEDEILQLVASVEEGSGHIVARAIQEYAKQREIPPQDAVDVTEVSGAGVRGTVRDCDVVVGSEEFVSRELGVSAQRLPQAGSTKLRTYIAIDGRLAGHIEFDDVLRSDLPQLMAELRKAGLRRLTILSGDDAETVAHVAQQVDVDDAYGELSPESKVDHVKRLLREYGPTLMIGDGVNDAPALASATVGMAVSPRGAIAAETAGVTLLGDDLLRVADAIYISRRTLRIARQSIWVGLALSGAGMVFAAVGLIGPIAGALYQEAIDVGVILNALRAAGISAQRPTPIRTINSKGADHESPRHYDYEVARSDA